MDPLIIGLITNITSEIVFKEISSIHNNAKKLLKPTFTKTYLKTLKKIEKKYPGSKNTLNRIFKNIRVKKKILSLKGGKSNILNYIKNFARKQLKNKDAKLNIEKIIEEFYTLFINEIRSNPDLIQKLRDAYLDEIAFTCKDIKEKTDLIPGLFKNVEDMKKEMAKIIAEKSKFTKVKGSNFYSRQGAFQFRIYGSNCEEITNIIDITFKLLDVKKENNKTILEFIDESEERNIIRMMYQGSLFKVIYPPEDKSTKMWLVPKNNYVEITCFANNFHKKEELRSILKTHIDATGIKEITFDEKIVDFLKKHLRNITYLKYNPRMKHKIKIKKVTHVIKGKIGIFGGDPQFLLNKSIKPIIDGLQKGKAGKYADTYFFKAVSVPKIYSSPLDFDFHRDGRIIGYFPKKNLNLQKIQTKLYNFIISNGNEY